MKAKPFKANIFDVDVGGDEAGGQLPFAKAIERVRALPLGDRVKNVKLKDRRLEHHDQHQGCFLLNFTTFDFPGPGRVSQPTPAVPIGLREDEFFANETAMLYDPDEELAFVEAMRGGMGAGAIADYFEWFAGRATAYRLIPRLDPEAAARARRQRQFRKVVMRVALGPVSAVDRDGDVGAIEALGEAFGARFVDVELKIGPERAQLSHWNGF